MITLVAARYYHCHEPNTCLVPNGFCSMGFCLPGAIAASFVHPKRRILGIAGDAGFLMNSPEMETARRYNRNFTMMIWEDFEYGLIAWKQWGTFGHHTDLKFGNPDWVQMAKAFGWNGYRCENSRDLKSTLEQSFEADGPSLVAFQSAVFTRQIDTAMEAYERLDASAVMVNDHTAFRVDWMPFSGLRESGLGVGGIPHTMHDMQTEKMLVMRSPSL